MQPHANSQNLQHLPFPELEALRAQLGVSQARLIREADLSSSTYQRWLKWMRGEDGGCQPQPRSLRALRDALAQRLLEHPEVRITVGPRQSA